ncbi:unnamed protein product [Acanthosepion pharaonis]|uniref:C-type lectin domain-containing protein n=1 Tax=Acanthosepion pharaonis TaxID=158019 RepID=A0A812BGT4_ACAPH|nr:unnamed protein product [Sepia pharaonis]
MWTTGEEVTWSYWAKGQPKTWPFTISFEDCAQMRRSEGWRWHDYTCNLALYHYNSICQFPLKGSSWGKPAPQSAPSEETVISEGNVLGIVISLAAAVMIIMALIMLYYRRWLKKKYVAKEPAVLFQNTSYAQIHNAAATAADGSTSSTLAANNSYWNTNKRKRTTNVEVTSLNAKANSDTEAPISTRALTFLSPSNTLQVKSGPSFSTQYTCAFLLPACSLPFFRLLDNRDMGAGNRSSPFSRVSNFCLEALLGDPILHIANTFAPYNWPKGARPHHISSISEVLLALPLTFSRGTHWRFSDPFPSRGGCTSVLTRFIPSLRSPFAVHHRALCPNSPQVVQFGPRDLGSPP